MSAQRNPRPEILDSVALLVVDAQDCFIDTLHNKEDFLLRASFAIEAARSLRIHTIFTEQAADKLGGTNAKLLSLAPKSKIFHKKTFSALNAPGIERYLREKEIYHLLVIGLETPICIYQTGLQAHDEDIDVTLLADALGARRPQDSQDVFETLRRLEIQILPSESVFYSLLGDVNNAYFRDFNSLVKAYGEKEYDEAEFKLSEDEIRRIRLEQRSNEPKQRPERKPRRSEEEDYDSEEGSEDSSEDQTFQEDSPDRNRRENRRGNRGRDRRNRRGGRNRDRRDNRSEKPSRQESSEPKSEPASDP
ncbi:MAG: cysteine hydrolase, partial [Verrucomicrobiota bacterium]